METTTFFFRGYNPYIGGLNPSFFMALGSKGIFYKLLPPKHPPTFTESDPPLRFTFSLRCSRWFPWKLPLGRELPSGCSWIS